MEIVKSEYDLKYILKGGLVRSSASGKFEGNDYSSSVRISSSNIYDVVNEKTGFTDEVEQKVVFIPTVSDKEIPWKKQRIAGETPALNSSKASTSIWMVP